MNILLLGEYSGLNNELKSALIRLGHDVTLAAANDFYKEYPADINLGYGSNIYSYKLRQLFLPLFKSNKFKGYDIVHVINFYTFPRSPVLNLWLVKFLKKHNKAKIVILDIPLLLENKINSERDILIFVESKKSDILKKLKKRKNFNQKLLKKFKEIQLSTSYKKKKSKFIIKNDFTKKSVREGIKNILKEIV